MPFLNFMLSGNGAHQMSHTDTATSTAPVNVAFKHQYDFGRQTSVVVTAERNHSGIAEYKAQLAKLGKTPQEINLLADIKSVVFTFKFYDRTDNQVLGKVRGRLHEIGGDEGLAVLEETWGDNPNFVSAHLCYYENLPRQSVFDAISTSFSHDSVPNLTNVWSVINGFLTTNRLLSGNEKGVVVNIPALVGSGNSLTATQDPSSDLWQQKLRELAPNYIAMIGADSISLINAFRKLNKRTGGHLFIDVGNAQNAEQVTALATTLGYDDHQVRLMWNPTKSRPSDGSSVRKAWRPCVGDYMAKHIVRNQMRDANGIPPLHVPVGGYDFPITFGGMQYLEELIISDKDQEDLAEVGVITVINEKFNREMRWIYGDVLTQRNSRTSALRLSNAAEIETFTARSIIEISKRHLLSSMNDYRNKAMSDGTRFLDNCVAAGLLEPAEQLGGLYYSLSIEPRADKPFEAVDIKLARRATGAVRQAFLETTINK